MSEGQTKTTGFAKAVNEEAVPESSMRSKQLSTKRQRRESKYLSPPYVNLTKAKKSRKKKEDAAEEEQVCGGSWEKEQDDMNITLSALKAASASSDKNRNDAVSELNAIRKKLEISSYILDKYHNEFKRDEKARLMDDMKKFGEQVEAVRQRIHGLAESTSIS